MESGLWFFSHLIGKKMRRKENGGAQDFPPEPTNIITPKVHNTHFLNIDIIISILLFIYIYI